LRGLGKFVVPTIVAAVGYYVVAFPMELFFVFYLEKGVIGIWYGQMFGSIFHFAMN
jgi:Na+-driven multidrug efflux pump